MLGGLDPVIIIQLKKRVASTADANIMIPVVSQEPTLVNLPPIPIYLSEKLFNVAIGGASKSMDVETDTETLTNGNAPDVNQKGIQSSVEITIEGKQDSVALTLLSAMIDQVYDRVTSKEYSISLLYGATTIFNAVLHSFSSETVEGTDKLLVKIKLSRGSKNPVKPNPVGSVPGATNIIPVGAA